MASKAFDMFCHQVCSVIRWKPARYAAWAELDAHLEDHAAVLEEQGVPPKEAARRAVEAMGDPYKLGHQLDKCHSPLVPRLSRIFALLALAVLLLSLVIGVRAGTGIFALANFIDTQTGSMTGVFQMAGCILLGVALSFLLTLVLYRDKDKQLTANDKAALAADAEANG